MERAPQISRLERGRNIERGLRPLSPVLPSPANKNSGGLLRPRLERGQG